MNKKRIQQMQPMWFAVHLKGAQEKEMVRHLERAVGPVIQSLVPPPGSVVIVRFQDSNNDAIFQRLSKDFGLLFFLL